MFELIPSYFDINISFFVLLIVGILSGLFAYYQYKRTVPPVSKFLQISLGFLRGSAVACILLLLFAPEFTAIWQRTEQGKLIIAIDKSASMGIIENKRSRLERALQIADNIISQVESEANVTIFGFDSDTTRFIDLAMDTTRLGTNLDQSLRSILDSDKQVSNIVLLTDGNFTLGDNPLYSDYLNRVRLYSIGIGDTLDIADIMITDVKSNKIVYQNQPTQIQVFVMSRGIDAQHLKLRMRQDNRILQVKDIQLNGDAKTIVSEFELIPERVGLNQYDFSIEKLSNESITDNNDYTISMEVLKGKIDLGFFASKPGYEQKFLHHMLSNEEDINFHMSVRVNNGKYFDSNPAKFIDSLDVVILNDYPPSLETDPLAGDFIKRLTIQKVPALIILSEKVNRSQLELLKNFFPIKSIRQSSQILESQIQPTVAEHQLSVLSIFENEAAEERFWNVCPPIQYSYSDVIFTTPVTKLLETTKSNLPVLIAQDSNKRKGILMLGAGFWRWNFLLAEDEIYHDSWKQMLKNMIRWLDTGAIDKNVILSTGKKYYQVGDNVLLTTQVYDGSFKLVNDGLIRTTVTGPSISFEIESNFVENGRYEGSFVPLMPGRYRIKSEAWRNNITLGDDEIDLIVTTVNREFLSTRQNYHLLKRMSKKSGGEYFNETEAAKLLKYVNLNPKLKRESETIELWNRWPFLVIIIFLLSLEWFVRKKKDLA